MTETKRKGHSPPSLSPVPVVPLLCLCLNPGRRVQQACARVSFLASPLLPVFAVPLPGLLHHVLLQPGRGQGLAGPEEAREKSGALPAPVPGVFVQQKAGLVELPGSTPEPFGQIPAVVERDTEVHSSRSPGRGHAARCCELLSITFIH